MKNFNIKYVVEYKYILLLYMFAMIHIGDCDLLGMFARKVWDKFKSFSDIEKEIEKLEEIFGLKE